MNFLNKGWGWIITFLLIIVIEGLSLIFPMYVKFLTNLFFIDGILFVVFFGFWLKNNK